MWWCPTARMKSAIANDPYGYVSVGHIDETVSPVALDGVVPTIETVKNGTYAVARGLLQQHQRRTGRSDKVAD